MNRGIWDPVNVNLFPVTAKAISDARVPAVEVFFASMKPHTDIKPHSDFTNFVLTSHLAIEIPYSGENKCRLYVGDTEKQWINGEVMIFDTSILQGAMTPTPSSMRVGMCSPHSTQTTKVSGTKTFLARHDKCCNLPTIPLNFQVSSARIRRSNSKRNASSKPRELFPN
jgi:Aspartyl/Asparaginyl beta-hydroxylase